MATSSHAKTLLGGIQTELKKALGEVLDYVFTGNFAFGPIEPNDAQTKTQNFLGRYVKVTTSGTANREVAVAHGLGRIPNVVWQVTSPRVVNSVVGVPLTVSRAADDARVYLSSASTGVTVWLYLE